MGYLLARIRELKTELAAMPAVDPAVREVNKQEAIRELAPEIGSLQKRGYSLEQVVALLAARADIPITVGTLRTYLSRLKGRRVRGTASDAPSTSRRRSRRPAAERAETAPSTTREHPENAAVGTGDLTAVTRNEGAADDSAAFAQPAADQGRAAAPGPNQRPEDSESTPAMTAAQPAGPSPQDRSLGGGETPAITAPGVDGNPPDENTTTEQGPQVKQPQAPARSSINATFTAREDTEDI